MLSLVHVGHYYCHPIIVTSFSQGNSSEFAPIMPEEFGEHLTRGQRLFLHPESLQILQNLKVRSGNCDSHGRSFILYSVTHFCVYDVCFGLLS